MFNPSSDTYHYIKNDMMLENIPWGSDQGTGDALWRTSIAYIAYGDPRLKTAILKCFRKFTMINREEKYWYQGSRYVDRYREDDVSRDQVILALTALKFNDDEKELKELVDHLPKRLSRRFKMSFVLRYWMKAVSRNSRWYTFWFHFFELMELVPSVMINKTLRPLARRAKQYDSTWYMDHNPRQPFWHEDWSTGKRQWMWISNPQSLPWVNNGHKLTNNFKHDLETNKFRRFIDKILYPGYALHLTSWLVSLTNSTVMKQMLQKLICWEAEDNNLLIRMLMTRHPTQKQIDQYQPLEGFRWSSRMDGTSNFNYLTGDNAHYNTLDKDLLLKLNEKKKRRRF